MKDEVTSKYSDHRSEKSILSNRAHMNQPLFRPNASMERINSVFGNLNVPVKRCITRENNHDNKDISLPINVTTLNTEGTGESKKEEIKIVQQTN